MATYDFVCDYCEHEFEKLLRMADYEQPLNEPCPKCAMVGYVRRKITGGLGFNADTFPKRHQMEFRENMERIKKNNPGNNIPDY